MPQDNNKPEDIPEMSFDKKYSNKLPEIAETPDKVQKEMEKVKKELEKLKNFIIFMRIVYRCGLPEYVLLIF